MTENLDFRDENSASEAKALGQTQGAWTNALLAVLVLVFLGQLYFQTQAQGFSTRISPLVLYQLGANHPLAILNNGQYWRWLSSCFLHIDILHIVMNGMALRYLGRIVEEHYGARFMLLAFICTGVAGSVVTTFWHMGQMQYLSAGASGGLYGLFGVIFVMGKRYKAYLNPGFQQFLNQNLALLIVVSFAPFIDMWGHFGGLAAGALLGLLVTPRTMKQLFAFLKASKSDAFSQLNQIEWEEKP